MVENGVFGDWRVLKDVLVKKFVLYTVKKDGVKLREAKELEVGQVNR
jgi:hypothetical protein